MAAGVRLRSSWGVAAVVCLMMAWNVDPGEGLPLRGGEAAAGQVFTELLEESSSESILDELAKAERIGSGESAYSQQQDASTQLTAPMVIGQVSTSDMTNAVGKAAQVDLLASLNTSPHIEKPTAEAGTGMFDDVLKNWDAAKSSVMQTASDNEQVLTTDLSNSVENHSEENLIGSFGDLSVALGTGTKKGDADKQALQAAAQPADSDPLAVFQKEFSAGLDDPDSSMTPPADTPSPAMVMPQVTPAAVPVEPTPMVAQLVAPVVSPVVAPAVTQPAPTDSSSKHDWMTNALAEWGNEQDSSLDPTAAAGTSVTPAPASEQHNDLGESDDVDATAATAEKNLNDEIEGEAQEAASEVVKSTMAAVEKDFMFTEKAITNKLGADQHDLTLEEIEKAGGKTREEELKNKAKKAHKEMLQKASVNFDLAMANVHKTTQQQLANQLAGLKSQLRDREDKVLSTKKVALDKAKDDMETTLRFRVGQLMQKMKANLPAKLTIVKQKAEAIARKVASMAIETVTDGAKKVRLRLRNDLGEAAGRVHAAETKLSASDANPSEALKAAVDVRTEKQKYKKLHDLAETALVQQKSKASKKIVEAENNAKESVRLAVHDAQTKELKEAQGQLSVQQKTLEAEETKKLKLKVSMIKRAALEHIQQERAKFKSLVDAAVKLAPQREQALQMQAKVSLQKAKSAAAAYEEKMISTLAPHTVDGKTISQEMAGDCVKNPAGCSMFTLKNQNIDAAAKFAEHKARKAQDAQKQAKEGVAKAMEKLRVTSAVSQKYAQEARSMDEKQTRIKLAKLQLNEAQASAAFHSAAKAHLQSQLINTKMSGDEQTADSKMQAFERALNEMKVTHDEKTEDESVQVSLAKQAAFAKARLAAKALLNLPQR